MCCSAAITVRSLTGDVNNRSSVRNGGALTFLTKHRDPWTAETVPSRGNPTAEFPLKGNKRATAREIRNHESHRIC